jgi:hypothetical protein
MSALHPIAEVSIGLVALLSAGPLRNLSWSRDYGVAYFYGYHYTPSVTRRDAYRIIHLSPG